MKCFMSCLFLLLTIVSHNLSAADNPEPALNPHLMPMREPRPQCLGCHAEVKQTKAVSYEQIAPMFVGDGIGACVSCHESAAVKHMVGRSPNFHVPNYLPLDAQGRITCLTCHYTHGALRSDKPWVDVSWFERLTNSERLHKTFLLRHHNREGSLCLACHDS